MAPNGHLSKTETKGVQPMKKLVVYSGADRLPSGRAAGGITEGCMVLEGGAFRGVYTSGVLDALISGLCQGIGGVRPELQPPV